MKREKGSTLLEVLVSLALLGIISVLFLGRCRQLRYHPYAGLLLS